MVYQKTIERIERRETGAVSVSVESSAWMKTIERIERGDILSMAVGNVSRVEKTIERIERAIETYTYIRLTPPKTIERIESRVAFVNPSRYWSENNRKN